MLLSSLCQSVRAVRVFGISHSVRKTRLSKTVGRFLIEILIPVSKTLPSIERDEFSITVTCSGFNGLSTRQQAEWKRHASKSNPIVKHKIDSNLIKVSLLSLQHFSWAHLMPCDLVLYQLIPKNPTLCLYGILFLVENWPNTTSISVFFQYRDQLIICVLIISINVSTFRKTSKIAQVEL